MNERRTNGPICGGMEDCPFSLSLSPSLRQSVLPSSLFLSFAFSQFAYSNKSEMNPNGERQRICFPFLSFPHRNDHFHIQMSFPMNFAIYLLYFPILFNGNLGIQNGFSGGIILILTVTYSMDLTVSYSTYGIHHPDNV